MNRKITIGWVLMLVICLISVCSGLTQGLTLTDIPNEAAFPYAKDIINSNNFLIEVAAGNMSTNTSVTTATLVSNATLMVYGSNLVIKSGGTLDLPDASIASANLPATISNSTLISNDTAKVSVSNLNVKAGGIVTVPANSIASAAIVGGMSWTVTNSGTGYTNLWCYTNGIFESYTATGTMP